MKPRLKLLFTAALVIAFLCAAVAFISVQLWSGVAEGQITVYGRAMASVATRTENPAAFYTGVVVYSLLAIFLLWLALGLSVGIIAKFIRRVKSTA
jgi:hypothetical protein